MKKITLLIIVLIFLSGCSVTNLVGSSSSNLTPEYACILKQTYSENGEKTPNDILEFLEEEGIDCNGSSATEEEPKIEVVKIIRSEKEKTKEKTKEETEKDDDPFIVKRPRIF
tara:strand:- start:20 stop:358 length:339 start_codon:yes stop_codon:yes gene_type:complete